MVSEKEIEAEMIGWQHALSAAARVRAEDNSNMPLYAQSTAEQTQPVRVKVKPLEWIVETPTWCEADGLGKLYRVFVQPSGKATLKHGSFDTGVDYPSLEAAKAASQADYERRILATLESTDAVPVINAMFETSENGITGTRFVDVKRVEHEDDGSLTVVIDYWPRPASAAGSVHPTSSEARLREVLANLVQEIDDLVSESEGVAGLHLNGDVAEWSDLLPGGLYERLTSLDDARAALEQETSHV